MRKYGPEQSQATHYLHVCYDDYFGSPSIFIYTKASALRIIEQLQADEARLEQMQANAANGLSVDTKEVLGLKLNRAFLGGREGGSDNTGYGFNVTPEELNAVRHAFVPNAAYEDLELGRRAENDAEDWLVSRGWQVVRATDRETQQSGIDMFVSRDGVECAIDVKARRACYRMPRLSLQLEECNPDKRYV